MASRKLELIFTGDTSKLERAFRRVGKETDTMAGKMGRSTKTVAKFAAAGGAALGVAFVAGAVKAGDAASDLSESINKMSAVFERSAPEVGAWADQAATSMGMTKTAALDGAASIGAMLKPMGIAPGEAAKMSMSMAQLAGDMGSFNNQDPTEMLDRIRAGLSGESEPLKQFGSNLSDARVKLEAVRMGIAAEGEQLSETDKIRARYSLLLRDTTDQHGDFAKTSDGMANATRILKAEVGNLSADIGVVMVPVMLKAVQMARQVVETIREWWPKIGPTVANALTVVRSSVDSAVTAVRENWDTISAVTSTAWEIVRGAIAATVDWIRANVVPTVRAVVGYLRGLWQRHGDDIRKVMRDVLTVIQSALKAVRAAIQVVMAVIRGDWSTAWNGIKDLVKNVIGGLGALVRALGRTLIVALAELGRAGVKAFAEAMKGLGNGIKRAVKSALSGAAGVASDIANAGLRWGKGLIDGIVDGIKAAGSRIKDALRSVIPDSIGVGPVSVPIPFGRTSGGFTPGAYRGRDHMLAALDGNEAVLNPRQQAMIPGGRGTLVDIFRRTGGRSGGHGFTTGGFTGPVADAYHRATGKLGTAYSYGKWDCSKFAYYAAGYAPGPGQTTKQAATSDSVPAKGSEPVIWGLRKSHSGPWQAGKLEHMGIGILGPDGRRRWFDNGSGGVQSNADSARWQLYRVPKIWANAARRLGVSIDGDTGTNTKNANVTPLQAAVTAFKRAGLSAGAAGGAAARALQAAGGAVSNLSDRQSGGNLTSGETRAVAKSGIDARRGARAQGLDPQAVADAGEKAEREATARFLRTHIRSIDKDRKRLAGRKAGLLRDLAKVRKAKGGGKAAASRRIYAGLRNIRAELRELGELRAEAVAALLELLEAAEADTYAAQYGADSDGGDTTDAGPTESDYLSAQVAQAQLTATTADDIAAARAVLGFSEREYQAAVAAGDPRSIASTAGALLSARSQLEQLEATQQNTEAVKENTAAINGVGGGSIAFSYRGQSYVLRGIAPPSSDRLETLAGV